MIDPCRKYYYELDKAESIIKLLKSRYPTNYGEQPEFRKAMHSMSFAKQKIQSFNRMKAMGIKF